MNNDEENELQKEDAPREKGIPLYRVIRNYRTKKKIIAEGLTWEQVTKYFTNNPDATSNTAIKTEVGRKRVEMEGPYGDSYEVML